MVLLLTTLNMVLPFTMFHSNLWKTASDFIWLDNFETLMWSLLFEKFRWTGQTPAPLLTFCLIAQCYQGCETGLKHCSAKTLCPQLKPRSLCEGTRSEVAWPQGLISWRQTVTLPSNSRPSRRRSSWAGLQRSVWKSSSAVASGWHKSSLGRRCRVSTP